MFPPTHHRPASLIAITLFCLAATGCVPKNWIVWSPDQKTAAVLSNQGLQLTQNNGKLSPVLIPNAIAATWSPDGAQLLVSETEEVIWFDDLRKNIADQQLTEILEVGQIVHHLTQSPKLDSTFLVVSDLIEKLQLTDAARAAVALYLQDELEQEAPKGLLKQDINIPTVNLVHYRLYHFTGRGAKGQLEPAYTLASNLFDRDTFHHPRFSPDGRAVAYLAGIDTSEHNALWISETKESAAAEVLADRAVAFAWAPDSKRLAWFEPVDNNDVTVMIKARAVRDAADNLRPVGPTVDMAGLVAGNTQFLHVLPDNQILFAATPIELPISANNFQAKTDLYRLDPENNFAISPVIDPSQSGPNFTRITAFSVSPNGKRLAYVDNEGRAGLIDLANGAHTVLQADKINGTSIALIPAWRGNNELTVVLDNPEKRIGGPAGAVTLWKDGAATQVLGADWPRAAFKSRLGEQNKLK
jgi:hypothetical protein